MKVLLTAMFALLLTGCATTTQKPPMKISSVPYRGLDCNALLEERREVYVRVQEHAVLSSKEQSNADGMVIADMILFGFSTLGHSKGGKEEAFYELARGEYHMVSNLINEKQCAIPAPKAVKVPNCIPYTKKELRKNSRGYDGIKYQCLAESSTKDKKVYGRLSGKETINIEEHLWGMYPELN